MIARLVFIGAAFLTTLLALDFRPSGNPGEFYALIAFSTAGMCFMAGASELITAYLALELSSISLYILAGYFRNDTKSAEAGIKYFLFGALSSGILLYGMSLAYGFTASVNQGGAAGDRHTVLVDRRGRRRRPGRHLAAEPGDDLCAGRHRLQGCGGAVPQLVARCLPGRAHADHRLYLDGVQDGGLYPALPGAGGGVPVDRRHAGRRVQRLDQPAGGHRAGDGAGGQPVGPAADQRQAAAGLFEHRPRRLPAAGAAAVVLDAAFDRTFASSRCSTT